MFFHVYFVPDHVILHRCKKKQFDLILVNNIALPVGPGYYLDVGVSCWIYNHNILYT